MSKLAHLPFLTVALAMVPVLYTQKIPILKATELSKNKFN